MLTYVYIMPVKLELGWQSIGCSVALLSLSMACPCREAAGSYSACSAQSAHPCGPDRLAHAQGPAAEGACKGILHLHACPRQVRPCRPATQTAESIAHYAGSKPDGEQANCQGWMCSLASLAPCLHLNAAICRGESPALVCMCPPALRSTCHTANESMAVMCMHGSCAQVRPGEGRPPAD